MPSAGLRQCIHGVTSYLVYLVFIAALGPLQFGFHLAELNAPQDVITCKITTVATAVASPPERKLVQCIPMSEAEFALISSMFVLGGFIGAIASGPISSQYGRLLAMRIVAVSFIIGASIEALAGSVPTMGLGRMLSGVGGGASTVIIPIYIAEIAPPNERGLFGTMTQIAINIGILITQTMGFYLSKGSTWRIILSAGSGLGLLQGIGLIWMPESPPWLASHKQTLQAIRVLQRIRGANYYIDDEIQDWEIHENELGEEERFLIQPEPRRDSETTVSSKASRNVANVGFFQIAKDPFYRPALIAVVGILVSQQFTGINSIMMYSVSLLAGVLPISSSLLTIMISIVNLVTTMICAPLPDMIGRKACLLISIAGMGTMSLCLAIAMRVDIKILSAISVLAFVAFFAGGLGPVPFMMASEMVGTEAVGATQSWALGANYVATFLVAQFFPILNTLLNNKLGGKGWVYFIFTGLAVLCFLFVSWRVPETKGKQDPDEVWGRDRRVD